MKNIKRLSVAQVKTRAQKLKSERLMWESHWQEIADHFLTNKNTITNQKSEGQKRTWQLLDNTGAIALETLAAALNSFLTNPNSKWFSLGLTDAEMMKRDDVQRWLQHNTNTMRLVLNNSNFNTAVQEFYQELLGFGNGCTFIEENDKTIVNFNTHFIRDYYFEEDRFGRVCGVYREFKLTAGDIAEQFGMQALSDRKLKRAFDSKSDDKFCIIHAVYPVTRLVPDDKSGKYVSQYVVSECDYEVSFGEYMEFPFGAARWSKAAGEKYGRSPAMTALPELKVLNKMNETMLRGAQKLVDPPLMMPDDGFVLPIITGPAGINYYRAGTSDRIETFANDTRLDFGYQAMEDRRKRVREAFYIDQLRLPQGGPMMTATEVMQRKDEAAILLGPMFGRIEPEYLRALLRRVFNILNRRGMITQPPINLGNSQIDVKFTGLIAKAQETVQAQNIARLLASAAPLINLDNLVAQNFDGDAIVRILAQSFDVPSEALRTPEDIESRRQAQMEGEQAQAQAQLAMMQQQQGVDNSLTVAKAMKETQGI